MARQRAVTQPTQELPGYGELLDALKARIKGAQVRAALAANRELIALYWDVGRAIVGRQESDEWGTSVIERLSRDLREAFPEAHGFSPRNLWRMRRFYLAYAGPEPPPQSGMESRDLSHLQIIDVRSVLLPQPVAEIAEPLAEAAETAVLFEILPQPVAEIGVPAGEGSGAAALFEILPQAVAELSLAPPPAEQSGFLRQPVAEITVVSETGEPLTILPQPVAELPNATVPGPNPRDGNSNLPRVVAENRDAGASFPGSIDENAILPQVVAELPWGHNIVLLEKLRSRADRLWYAGMATRHGWSRNVLVHQIESRLHARSGRAITNFERTIPAADSDLVRELLKDPYHFTFLQLGATLHERELERALLANVQHFLMELGLGFALVGNQFHLEVGGQDYYLDLLLFHIHLRRYMVVELKIGAFQPEDAGKMNFYLAAVDQVMRDQNVEPSIGLILCKERNRVVAEYALRGSTHPIGVAEFQLTERLPDPLQARLPSVRDIERRLEGDVVLGA